MGYLGRLAAGLGAAAIAAVLHMAGPAMAEDGHARPAGAYDVATFWYLNAPTCPAGETVTPGGCVCETGLTRVDGLCIVPPAPGVGATREAPRPKVAAEPKPVKKTVPRKAVAQTPRPAKSGAPGTLRPTLPQSEGIAGYSTTGTPCMDSDLVALLTETYGKRPGVSACVAGCLPRPTGTLKSVADLDRLARENGVAWCPDSCIQVTGWMPPAEVLRIQQQTGRVFCPTEGQNYCRAPDMAGVPVSKTIEKVLAFVKDDAAPAPAPTGSVAVILGFGSYGGKLPANDHALRDADAVEALMTRKLGYAPDAVVFANDATKADILKMIAPGGTIAGKTPTQSLFLYVSGHGLSDPATGKAYLLPSDADPARLAETALPLQDLYDALGKLGAPSLTVAIEAAFPTSVQDLIDPPNLPDAEVGVLPEKPIPGLSVFTAADRDQQTLVDPELGTGLFTRWLLEGLAGAADLDPTGNNDRRIESVELYVFTAHHVRVTARKSFGLEQKPLISESQNALMRSF